MAKNDKNISSTEDNGADNYLGHFSSMAVYGLVVTASMIALYALDRIPEEIPAFDFIVLTLAVFRLIRLFVYDLVTDFIRDYFSRFDSGIRMTVAELLYCPWCTGVWVAWLVGFAYFVTPYAWYPLFLVALAGLGSILQVTSTLLLRVISAYK